LKGLHEHEQGVKGLSIEELNRQLGNQLQNILANGNDMAKGNKRNEQLNSEDNKETCIKCHKKCRTRSTFSETGNH
jgi:two-component SAPR family response regulator